MDYRWFIELGSMLDGRPGRRRLCGARSSRERSRGSAGLLSIASNAAAARQAGRGEQEDHRAELEARWLCQPLTTTHCPSYRSV